MRLQSLQTLPKKNREKLFQGKMSCNYKILKILSITGMSGLAKTRERRIQSQQAKIKNPQKIIYTYYPATESQLTQREPWPSAS